MVRGPFHLKMIVNAFALVASAAAQATQLECQKDLATLAKREAMISATTHSKLYDQTIAEFLTKLLLRTKSAEDNVTALEKIKKRLGEAADNIIQKKLAEAAPDLEKISQGPSTKRGNATKSIVRRIAREALAEVSIDRIVAEETLPYLENFYRSLGDQEKALYDEVIGALHLRIRERLKKTLPENEVDSTVEQLMQEAVTPLAEILATEVALGEKPDTPDKIRNRQNRIILGVLRKIEIDKVDWHARYPRYADFEKTLGRDPEDQPLAELWRQLAPELIASEQSLAWRNVDSQSREAQSAEFMRLEQETLRFARRILLAELSEFGAAETAEARLEQIDRLKKAFSGLHALSRTNQLNFLLSKERELTPTQFYRFLRGYTELNAQVQKRVTYDLGRNENWPLEFKEHLRLVVISYLDLIRTVKSSDPLESDEMLMRRIAVSANQRVPYDPGKIVLDPRLEPVLRELETEAEQKYLFDAAKRIQDSLQVRAEWLADGFAAQTILAQELYAATRIPLVQVLKRELIEAPHLTSSERNRNGRIMSHIRARVTLQPSEISLLPSRLQLLRLSLDGEKQKLFDQTLSMLLWRLERNPLDREEFANVFGPTLSEVFSENIKVETAEDSFAHQARVFARKVFDQVRGRPEGPSLLSRAFGEFDDLIEDSIEGAATQVVSRFIPNAAKRAQIENPNVHAQARSSGILLDGDAFPFVRSVMAQISPFESPILQAQHIENLFALEQEILSFLKTSNRAKTLQLNVDKFSSDELNRQRAKFAENVMNPLTDRLRNDMLEPSELVAMVASWNEKLEELEKRNVGLIVRPVQKYPRRHWDDLELVGGRELHRAALHFDPDYGTRFSTFATKFITLGLKDEFAEMDKPAHLSQKAHKRTLELGRLAAMTMVENGHRLSVEEIMEKMGISRPSALKVLENLKPVRNTSAEVEFEKQTLSVESVIPSPTKISHDEINQRTQKRIRAFNSIFSDITDERMRHILRARYGVQENGERGEEKTLDEIAREVNLSREMVRIITNGQMSEILRAIILLRSRSDIETEDRQFLIAYYGLYGMPANQFVRSREGAYERALRLIEEISFEDFESIVED